MIEAIVGVALRAILASVLLGGVLAVLVLVAVRALALTAATRHALWTTALIATAVMPLAGIAVSLVKAAPSPAAVAAPQLPAAHELALVSTTHAGSGPAIAALGPQPPNVLSAAVPAPKVAPRSALAGWTPRMSRELALGVVAIWAAGALAGLIGLAASIVRVRGLKRRSSPLDGTLADELPWLTAAGPGREIYLRLSFETETPVAVGFRRPVILIPTELASAGGLGAIEQLVMHEHAHLRRYDDWTNLVQRTIERIFWFNPIVWLVGRRIALEREIASDDAVVEKTGEAHAYATSLWRLAREMRMPEHAVVAPGALLTRKQITVRIEQLLDKKRARLHRSPSAALGVAAASLLAVAFVATSAPAVELPAPAAKPVAAATSAPSVVRHHDAAPAHAAVVKRTTPASKPAPKQNVASVTTAQQHVEYRLTVTENGPAPAAKRIVKIVTSNSGKSNALPHDTLPLPPVPPASAVPPLPAMPAMPASPALLPATLHKVHVATELALAHAKMTTDAAHLGPEIAKALSNLPVEIAQEGTVKKRVRLEGVKLSRELVASCVGCSLRGADLRGLDLRGVTINGNDLSDTDLRGANLSGAQLLGVNLTRANLGNADLRNAELNGVELRDAIFEGAQVEGIKLIGVSIRRANLRGVPLRSIISSCTGCDFSRLDMHGQDLRGITLNGADLSKSDLHDANLSGARFTGVDLSHANLARADLTNARFDGCNLAGADLRGARTTGMLMHGSSLGD